MTAATASPRRRRVLPHGPYVADGAVAVAVAAITLLSDFYGDTRTTGALIFDLVLALPLLVRRRAPATATALIATLCLLQWVGDVRASGPLALLVMLYTIGSRQCQRWLLPTAVVIAEIGVALAIRRWTPPGSGHVMTALMLTGTVTAAWVIGIYVRTRRSYLASMLERAETAERDRDAQARMAVADERGRIAREMHDIIAHSLSVMITLNDAAAAIEPTARVRQTITQASDVGRQALGEMQRMLTVLRSDDPPDLIPQPGSAQLSDLITQVRSTGLSVEMAVTGDEREVPATAQLALYRIVQESLTNILKHGRNVRQVTVDIIYQAHDVTVNVVNDGDAVPAVDSSDSWGHGLHGMRERAALYGGDVRAAPRPDGGWAVTADLHLTDPNAADPNPADPNAANSSLVNPLPTP